MTEYKDLIRQATAWLWVDPIVDPTTERVTLTQAVNDPMDLLPPRVPRPHTGTYIGYTVGGVTEDWGVEINLVGGDGFGAATRAYVAKEEPRVEADLIFAGAYRVRELFEPPGIAQVTQRTYGGLGVLPTHKLLVVIGAWWADDPIWECRLYYRGVFEPAALVTGRQVQPIRMVYRPLAGVQPDGSCRPPGDQIARTWWVRVHSDGTNEPVDPRRTTPLEDEVATLRRGESLVWWL